MYQDWMENVPLDVKKPIKYCPHCGERID